MVQEWSRKTLFSKVRFSDLLMPPPVSRSLFSKSIKFPKLCHNCLKPAEDTWELQATIAGSRKVVKGKKEGKIEALTFEVPTCGECLNKKNRVSARTRSTSIQVSLVILFLALFYLWNIGKVVLATGFKNAAFLPLFLPLIPLVSYILDRISRASIAVLDVTIGEDNRSLMKHLEDRRKREDAFIGAKLDFSIPTSVTFAFRDVRYASLFREENLKLVI